MYFPAMFDYPLGSPELSGAIHMIWRDGPWSYPDSPSAGIASNGIGRLANRQAGKHKQPAVGRRGRTSMTIYFFHRGLNHGKAWKTQTKPWLDGI